jgi:exosortase
MGLLLLGTFGAELFLMRLSFVVTLAALVLLHAGYSVLRAFWFPLAYLLFMIPLPALVYNAVAFPLQLVAANVSADILHLLHIPAFREGNIISLTFVTLEVNEACSGIRSLASLSALTVIFAQWTQPTPVRKLMVTFSTLPITIVTNVTRVVVTGILANYVNVSLAQGFFHAFSGWVVFIAAFVLLGLVGRLCRTFDVEYHERSII